MNRLTHLASNRKVVIGALLVIGIIIPFVTESTFIIHLLILSYLWAIMAGAYNLLMGYTGLLSLGHAAFYALGAYTSALLATKLGIPWPLGMMAAALVTAIASVFIGLLVLRLRGAYFLMIMFGFGEITRLVSENWDSFTGGVYGILHVPPLFESIKYSYLIVLLFGIFIYFFLYRLIHSHIGRTLVTIREDEDVAKSLGIDVPKYKLLAFVISAVIVGMAGSAMTHYLEYCYPEFAHFLQSVALLVYTVVGGAGYFIGPAVAAVIFTFLPEISRAIGDFQLLIYGATLVLVILFIPRGLEPFVRSSFSKVGEILRSKLQVDR